MTSKEKKDYLLKEIIKPQLKSAGYSQHFPKISFIVFIAGCFIIILCKKSSRFQAWAEKDVISFADKQLRRETWKEHKQKK